MNDMWKSSVAYLIGALSAMSLTAWLCDAKSRWIVVPVAIIGGILGQSLYLLASYLWDAFWDARKGK